MEISERLEDDCDECHDGLDKTKLKCRLFAEPEKSNAVRASGQAARKIQETGSEIIKTIKIKGRRALY